MSKINNEAKEKRFRFPGQDFVGFGRKISCVTHGGALWSAVAMETADKNTIVISRSIEGAVSHIEIPASPESGVVFHRPALVGGQGDTLGVVWNEFSNGTWAIKFAALRDDPLECGPAETVFSSLRLCMPPVGVYCADILHVVWPAVHEGHIRIMAAERHDEVWHITGPLSDAAGDALRPCICVTKDVVHVAWDQYRDKRYAIAGKRIAASGMQDIEPVGQSDERWFCPDVAATQDGHVYLTWVAMQEVVDDLGIADHVPFAMVGRLDGNTIELLEEGANVDNARVIADLREGLLASEISKGYVGLRRNPMLSVDAQDRLWCLWEVRIEEEATAVSGYLAGRCFDGQAWSEAQLLGNPGYGYAAPKQQVGDTLSFAHFRFAESGLDIIAHGTLDPSGARPHAPDPAKWSRWHAFDISPLVKSKRTAEVDGVQHTMFWADTHCHSNFSADAEGEPDEIIHYARDIAGLDALCVIDNDFYPNKTLSPAEWQIHQENSRHFTKNGEFVLFPGYEFTYHRHDLNPDFNHRCVIYPGPEGALHRRIDVASDSDYKLPEALKQSGAMTYPHHCTYELIDPALEWNVEVCSSWRVALEECDFSIRQLQAGKRFGFVGSSDAHRANPGLGGALTGLFAPELTPEALFDAYRNRRIIATQGFAIFIDFRVSGLFIGSQGDVDAAPTVTFSIDAPDTIESVTVMRDGQPIHSVSPDAVNCEGSFIDNDVESGGHFYFLKVKLVGDPAFNTDPAENARRPFTVESRYPHNLAKARGVFAWTSPVWVNRRGA